MPCTALSSTKQKASSMARHKRRAAGTFCPASWMQVNYEELPEFVDYNETRRSFTSWELTKDTNIESGANNYISFISWRMNPSKGGTRSRPWRYNEPPIFRPATTYMFTYLCVRLEQTGLGAFMMPSCIYFLSLSSRSGMWLAHVRYRVNILFLSRHL